MRQMSYSVAIRTLGKGGEKYLRELKSLECQTLQPQKIVAYIAEGYDLPKETIGKEVYVRCKKGMVAQRALPFDEINTDYILLLDDDMELAPDACQKMMEAAVAADADCLVLDIYNEYNLGIKGKLVCWLVNSIPHHDKNWAIKICRSSHYRYNANPSEMLRTMSGCGGAILVKKSACQAIHFEDECWLDNMPYAFMEDQLFVYKFHLYGFKTFMHYGPKVTHLDARTSHLRNKEKHDYMSKVNRYIVWHRSIFSTQSTTLQKMYAWFAYWSSELYQLLVSPIFCVKNRGLFPLYQVFTANWGG